MMTGDIMLKSAADRQTYAVPCGRCLIPWRGLQGLQLPRIGRLAVRAGHCGHAAQELLQTRPLQALQLHLLLLLLRHLCQCISTTSQVPRPMHSYALAEEAWSTLGDHSAS